MSKYKVVIQESSRMFDGVSIGYNNIDEVGIKYLNLSLEVAKQAATVYLRQTLRKLSKEQDLYGATVIENALDIVEENK